MEDFLNALLPRLFPALEFQCVPHEGKSDFEKRLAGKLRGWRTPGTRFVVVRDQNGADCRDVKAKLVELCLPGGRPDALVRIVCRELEAWYFGDVESLVGAFPRSAGRLRRELRKRQYQDPDVVVGPAKVLEDLIPEFSKQPGARAMGGRLTRKNRSQSYRVFLDGVERLHRQDGMEANP